MGISTTPPGTLVDDYEQIDKALFDSTKLTNWEEPGEAFGDSLWRLVEQKEATVFADTSHPKYVEVTVRIPKV